MFSFGGEEIVVNGPDHGLPAFEGNVDSDWSWHVLEARTDVPNCSNGPLTGYVDGDFDNVTIKEFPDP